MQPVPNAVPAAALAEHYHVKQRKAWCAAACLEDAQLLIQQSTCSSWLSSHIACCCCAHISQQHVLRETYAVGAHTWPGLPRWEAQPQSCTHGQHGAGWGRTSSSPSPQSRAQSAGTPPPASAGTPAAAGRAPPAQGPAQRISAARTLCAKSHDCAWVCGQHWSTVSTLLQSVKHVVLFLVPCIRHAKTAEASTDGSHAAKLAVVNPQRIRHSTAQVFSQTRLMLPAAPFSGERAPRRRPRL